MVKKRQAKKSSAQGKDTTEWRSSTHYAVFVLVVAAAGIATQCLTSNASPCDANVGKRWLPDVDDQGYWVLCVNDKTATVYTNASEPHSSVSWGSGSSIRDVFGDHVGFEGDFTLDVQEWTKHINADPLTFFKQPWVMYGISAGADGFDDVRTILVGTEEREVRDGWYVVMEGGSWRWPPIRKGFERRINDELTLRTRAVRPALYDVNLSERIEGVLKHIRDTSRVMKMTRSELSSKGGKNTKNTRVRSSYTEFVSYEENEHMRDLLETVAESIFLIPDGLRGWGRAEDAGFEDSMQLVKYKARGHYNTHRDYWDPREYPKDYVDQTFVDAQTGQWRNRHATLLWYLQPPKNCTFSRIQSCIAGGGQTWFPRACSSSESVDCGVLEKASWHPESGDYKSCKRDTGVLVEPRGAALFYSLRADGSMDEYSWHGGCPTAKDTIDPKLLANMWVWNTGVSEIWSRYQRRRGR